MFTLLHTAPGGLYGSLLTCLPDKQETEINETSKRSTESRHRQTEDISERNDCRSFITVLLFNIKNMHLLVSHLDEGVQSLSVHLQELCFNVQHVNFRPGNHCPDKDTICGAQSLETHRSRLHAGSRRLNIFHFHLRA